MYNPVQMWNYGSLFFKIGLIEKGRIFNESSFARLLIERGIEEQEA